MFNWFKQRALQPEVKLTYNIVVEQARKPTFYTDLKIADTVDGRFDVLGLHMCILFCRLKNEGSEASKFSQALFDLMFKDMDQSLREMGVGDLSVGKRVKEMGKAILGRLEAYDRAFQSDEMALEMALVKNIYRGDSNLQPQVGRLVDYVNTARINLAKTPFESIIHGKFSFECQVNG